MWTLLYKQSLLDIIRLLEDECCACVLPLPSQRYRSSGSSQIPLLTSQRLAYFSSADPSGCWTTPASISAHGFCLSSALWPPLFSGSRPLCTPYGLSGYAGPALAVWPEQSWPTSQPYWGWVRRPGASCCGLRRRRTRWAAGQRCLLPITSLYTCSSARTCSVSNTVSAVFATCFTCSTSWAWQTTCFPPLARTSAATVHLRDCVVVMLPLTTASIRVLVSSGLLIKKDVAQRSRSKTPSSLWLLSWWNNCNLFEQRWT